VLVILNRSRTRPSGRSSWRRTQWSEGGGWKTHRARGTAKGRESIQQDFGATQSYVEGELSFCPFLTSQRVEVDFHQQQYSRLSLFRTASSPARSSIWPLDFTRQGSARFSRTHAKRRCGRSTEDPLILYLDTIQSRLRGTQQQDQVSGTRDAWRLNPTIEDLKKYIKKIWKPSSILFRRFPNPTGICILELAMELCTLTDSTNLEHVRIANKCIGTCKEFE
jgi:hypothetical protein